MPQTARPGARAGTLLLVRAARAASVAGPGRCRIIQSAVGSSYPSPVTRGSSGLRAGAAAGVRAPLPVQGPMVFGRRARIGIR